MKKCYIIVEHWVDNIEFIKPFFFATKKEAREWLNTTLIKDGFKSQYDFFKRTNGSFEIIEMVRG